MAAEAALAQLPVAGWDALELAGQGTPLAPQQQALLSDPARVALLDPNGQLTTVGLAAYDRMQERMQKPTPVKHEKSTPQPHRPAESVGKARTGDEKATAATAIRHSEEREVKSARRSPVRPRQRQNDRGIGG